MLGGFPAMAEQALAALKQSLATAGVHLPAGVSAGHLLIGLMVAVFVASRFLSMLVLFPVGLAAYWGIQTDAGRRTLRTANAKLSAILRRPIPSYTALCALCLVVAILGYFILPGKAAAATSTTSTTGRPNSELLLALRDAYDQGYDDGVAGAQRRPPKQAPELSDSVGTRTESGSSSSSSMGVGQLMKYGAAGFFIYNLGKSPGGGWNPQQAAQNAKANPLPLIFTLVMLSGVLF